MTDDHRGFEFGLHAPQLHTRWRYEAAQAALAVAQRDVTQCEASLAELQDRRRHVTQQGVALDGASIDPDLHVGRLVFLGVLSRRIDAVTDTLQQRKTCRDHAVQHCLELQKRLDSLVDTHRRDVAVFVATRARKDARRADDEWIARVGMGRLGNDSEQAGTDEEAAQ